MKIDTRIGNIKDMVVNISISATVEEWEKIEAVLYEHVKNNFYGSPQWLWDRIDKSIGKIKHQLEIDNFDISKPPTKEVNP